MGIVAGKAGVAKWAGGCVAKVAADGRRPLPPVAGRLGGLKRLKPALQRDSVRGARFVRKMRPRA